MRVTITASSDSEVEIYLQEISKFKLLTFEDERELAHAIAKGDDEARDRMIRCNLRLVVSIAKHYNDRGMAFLDLIEEGNLGLLKAVTRFSPDQGCRFSTYASWWIKQTIRRALINKVKNVRVPAHMIEVLSRWKKASSHLTQQLGHEPSSDEIGEYLQFSPSKIAVVQQALSASAPIGRGGDEDNPFDLEDVLPGAKSDTESTGILGEYDHETLRTALEFALTERERHIVALHYGLGAEHTDTDREAVSLEKIGERIGLTRERVRQIESRALHKLQMYLQQKNAREERERLDRKRSRDEADSQPIRRPRARSKIKKLNIDKQDDE